MKAAIILLALVFSGCAFDPNIQAATGAALDKARAVADDEVRTTAWAACDLPHVGAIRRVYGPFPNLMEAWDAFCSELSRSNVGPLKVTTPQ